MTGPETLTLTGFLLARIEEDEYEASCHAPTHPLGPFLLAECAAKRLIVAEHQIKIQGGCTALCSTCEWNGGADIDWVGGCLTLRALALPYANHPDYRPVWKP